jgi:hypothetical protein
MCFNACIKIKNKYGINIEKRLDLVFAKHGYHVVRNPEHFEKSISIYSDGTPWLTVASDDIDELEMAELQKLASDFAEAFNTTAMIQPFQLSGGEAYMEYHFSSQHNAFDEPPFVKEGPTVLKRFMFGPECLSGEPFNYSCINTGGISQGLEVYIAGDFVEGDTAAFDPLYIQSYEYRKRDKKEFTFEAGRQKIRLDNGKPVYFYDFPTFMFPEGINPYSAALGFQFACIIRRSVNLCMLPAGLQNELDTLQLALVPKSNREGGVSWHRIDMDDIDLKDIL